MDILRRFLAFLKQEDSPTFLEYSLLIVVIAIVAMVGAGVFGQAVLNLFNLPPQLE